MVAFHNVGRTPIDPSAIQGALNRVALFTAAAAGRGRVDSGDRTYDSGGSPLLSVDAIDSYARHVDRQALDILRRDGFELPAKLRADAMRSGAMRADAGLTGGVGGFPRDFEFIRRRVSEERHKPLNSFRLFPVDSEVPLGAIEHTARRMLSTGEAAIYRGNAQFPRARVAWQEETFGTAYVVCAVDTNFFQTLTTDWKGLRQYQLDLRAAMRAVEERLNAIAWHGDIGSKLYGMLNYPHGHVKVIPTAFTASSASADIVAALHALVDAPMVNSGGVFMPNRLVTSPRIHRFLFNTQFSTASDTSIGEYFLRGQDAGGTGIRSIDMAQELQGSGPAGANQDGILAYSDAIESTAHVLMQTPTALPVYQATPVDSTTVIFAATGGMVSQDSGNNILGWATAA